VVRVHRSTRLSAPLLAALLALSVALVRAENGPTETQLKAVFLFNFTKYVGWPSAAFHGPADPLRICILGADPFGTVLEQTVRGEVVNERPLATQHIARVEEIDECRLLFVSASEEAQIPRILKYVAGKPVLTVGETDDFAESGGMINLLKEQNRIRFEINQDAAEQAGLKLSSQLLKLGRIVASRNN
jgi:uncharacterized protein DUF4154